MAGGDAKKPKKAKKQPTRGAKKQQPKEPDTPEEVEEIVGSEKQQKNRRGEHLKKYWFKKGQSGNPKGRPRRRTMRDRILETLKQDLSSSPLLQESLQALYPGVKLDGLDFGDALALSALANGVKGRSAAHLSLLLERSDGRITGAIADIERDTSLDDDEGGLDVDAEKARSVAFYREVVSDTSLPMPDRLRAQARIEELLGMIQRDDSDAEDAVDAVREALRDLDEATFGEAEDGTEDGAV